MELPCPTTTLLHMACQDGDFKKVEELLDNGADIESQDLWLRTPLYTAIQTKNETIVQLLLKRGSNIHTLDFLGISPLHIAASYADVRVFEYLLERGAKIDQKDYRGETPLFHAVYKNNGPVVEMLIAKGIDVNAEDKYGRIPLHNAARRGHLDILTILLDAGSEVDRADTYGETPLFMAVYINNKYILKLLLDRGAKVNIKNVFTMTPLHCAMRKPDLKFIKCLLNAGARIDVTNNYGFSPLDLADVKGGDHMIEIRLVLKRHLIKLLAANMKIDVFKVANNFEFNTIRCRFFKKSCLLEVESMKMKRFGGVSLYDVLVKTDDPGFADNIEMEQFISSDHLEEVFPEYADLLQLKFKEAKKRNNLLKFVVLNMKINTGGIFTEVHLPNEIKREIFCYLNNEELEIVREAFKDVS